MSRPYIKRLTRNASRDVFGNLSLSNQYQVTFNSLPPKVIDHLKDKYGIYRADAYMARNGGLLCSSATLPDTALTTETVKNDFIGISQEFAQLRTSTALEFSFYVDIDYTTLRIFEGWIDYISSGSQQDNIDELAENYYRRMRYPDDYKTSTMYITKFERSGNQRLDYLFVNAFPKAVFQVPVSYGNAELLQVSVQFVFDRYVLNPKGRIVPNPSGDFTRIEKGVAELDTRTLQIELTPKTTEQQQEPVTTEQPESTTSPRRDPFAPVGSPQNPLPTAPAPEPAPPTEQLANTGSGRDGTFGEGTYGSGRPSG